MSSPAAKKAKTASSSSSSPENAANGNKKKAPAATAAAAKATAKTPSDVFFEKLQSFIKDGGYKNAFMIRGVTDAAARKDESKVTEKDLARMRYVMGTARRDTKVKEMNDLLLGDQAGSSFVMFTTSFSYQVEALVLRTFKAMYDRTTDWSLKYDLLLGLTMALDQFDVWMHDNEGTMGPTVKALAAHWRALLKKSDEELGIDAAYTRPGTLAVLQDFKKKIEKETPAEYGLGKFNYK